MLSTHLTVAVSSRREEAGFVFSAVSPSLPAAQYFQAKPPIMMFKKRSSLFCKLLFTYSNPSQILFRQDASSLLCAATCHWRLSCSQLCRGQGLVAQLRIVIVANNQPNQHCWDCRCLQPPKMWWVASGWRAQLTSGLKCTTQQPTRWVEWKCR